MTPFLALVPCGSGSGPGPGGDVLEGLAQRIGLPDDQVAVHQGLQHLGGHHPVSAGVIGHFLLGWRPAGGRNQPPDGRQQHELSRGQVQRPQSPVEHLPPGQRRMVQPETRAHQRSAWSGPASSSLIPNGPADCPGHPGQLARSWRDPATTPWPRGSAAPSRLGLQRGEAATPAAVIDCPSCSLASLPARRWYALPGEGGCLLPSPSRGHVDYGWRYEVL